MDSFRARARECLSAARREIESGDPERLPYAALRLRMALEALTYERAQAYRDYVDTSDSDTWQPKKVMDALLAIDPNADKGGTLAIGLEVTPGVPAKEMTVLGKEHVIGLNTIRKHYDALGSFLHLPTIKQLRERHAPRAMDIRKHCDAVAEAVELALSSRVSNVVMGSLIEFECFRCKEQIERRAPLLPRRFETACPKCKAAYRLDGVGDEQIKITPATISVECHHETCPGQHLLWPDEAKPGTSWSCKECGAAYELVLRTRLVTHEGDDGGNSKNESASPQPVSG